MWSCQAFEGPVLHWSEQLQGQPGSEDWEEAAAFAIGGGLSSLRIGARLTALFSGREQEWCTQKLGLQRAFLLLPGREGGL